MHNQKIFYENDLFALKNSKENSGLANNQFHLILTLHEE